MNDLISRRKAFEYFVTLWNCIGTIMDRDEWEDICMTTANEIPSAQPEIIRCKDCKHLKSFKGVDWCLKLVRHTELDFFCGFGEEGTE